MRLGSDLADDSSRREGGRRPPDKHSTSQCLVVPLWWSWGLRGLTSFSVSSSVGS